MARSSLCCHRCQRPSISAKCTCSLVKLCMWNSLCLLLSDCPHIMSDILPSHEPNYLTRYSLRYTEPSTYVIQWNTENALLTTLAQLVRHCSMLPLLGNNIHHLCPRVPIRFRTTSILRRSAGILLPLPSSSAIHRPKR